LFLRQIAENVLGVNGECAILQLLAEYFFKAYLYLGKMKRYMCAQLVNTGSNFRDLKSF